jgi:hypothetical protein
MAIGSGVQRGAALLPGAVGVSPTHIPGGRVGRTTSLYANPFIRTYPL